MPDEQRQADHRRAQGVTIRPARATDAASAFRLFESGRSEDDTADKSDDPGEDITDFVQWYIDHPSHEMWIAEDGDGAVVGMIGLAQVSEDMAELRRLRVDREHRGRGVGTALVEHALSICRDRSYLKIVLDTFVERAPARRLFERFGFRASAGSDSDGAGKRRQAFYLDLYSGPSPGHGGGVD